MANPKGSAPRAAERRVKALVLAQGGASYREIGRELGVSHQQAYRDVDRALGDLLKVQHKEAGKLREMELARLNRMLLAIWPKAKAGDLPSIDRVIKILEKRSDLLGLKAPERHEFEHKFRSGMEALLDELQGKKPAGVPAEVGVVPPGGENGNGAHPHGPNGTTRVYP